MDRRMAGEAGVSDVSTHRGHIHPAPTLNVYTG